MELAIAELMTGVSFSTATLIFASGIVSALVWLITRRFVRINKGRLPPGPLGLPFFGATPFLGPNPQIKLTEWGQKYGNVFSLYMGPNLAVVLNDYDSIKAGYIDQGEVFSGRPSTFITRVLTRGYHGKLFECTESFCRVFQPEVRIRGRSHFLYDVQHITGVVTTEGSFWREQRRFLMRSFHELGVGKSRFEQICMEEAQCLIQAMLAYAPDRSSEEKSFNPRNEIDSSVANIIVGLTFGVRFARRDPKLRLFLDNQEVITSLLNQAGPLQVLPFLRYLPPYRAKFQRFEKVVQYGRDIVETEVHRIEKEFDAKQDPTCVTEFFVQKRAKDFGNDESGRKRAEQDQFSNLLNIITNVQVLFNAGTETSVTTLTWGILFLVRYPEMQQRCHDEIVERIGVDRPVNWDDRNALPFVNAFLHEVWRRANVVPLSVLRRTLEDTKLNGYFIPKHTWLVPNMWNVHRDPRHWNEPLKFNPDRFLQANNNNKTPAAPPANASDKKANLALTNMPFGIGKRQCAGEGIAQMEIFIFLANLIQQIEFYPAPEAEGGKMPTEDEIVTGVTVQPAYAFNVCVRPRISDKK